MGGNGKNTVFIILLYLQFQFSYSRIHKDKLFHTVTDDTQHHNDDSQHINQFYNMDETQSIIQSSNNLFITKNSTVITAQIGSTASLPCIIKDMGTGVASWIRRKDYHLLTVGMGTYSNDDRFFITHNRPLQNSELNIKKVKPSDEGLYECQLSSHPPSSIFVYLKIVEAKAEILGEPDKHVRSGSTFQLVCVLRDSTEAPVYVFWYHNERMINYDNARGVDVNRDSEKSILTIEYALKTDSGNYSCVPSNAKPSSISVHILNGEKPAAMHHGSTSSSSKLAISQPIQLLIVVWILILSVPSLKYCIISLYEMRCDLYGDMQSIYKSSHKSFLNFVSLVEEISSRLSSSGK